MFNTVQEYVRKCATCARTKASNQQPIGVLQPLPLPDHCWEQVSHDLITGLPKTPRGHDAIVTFVDRLSKRVIFVPTTSNIDAAGYADLFFTHVFRHFGLPKALISDWDPRFTSHFWKALFARLGTNLKMSTSHHPQTDGQTERANRTIEDMLRAFVSPYQQNWDEYLIAAEFAYNNTVQASTGFTPFYLNNGRHPHTPLSLALPESLPSPKDNNPAANSLIGKFQSSLARAKDALYRAQERQRKYANQSRRDAEFKVGDHVLLSTQHLSLNVREGSTPKLCPKYIGPFPIIQVLSPVAYWLKLPASMKCHDVFHISLLKPADFFSSQFPDRVQPEPPPVRTQNNQAYYAVDYILNHKPRSARTRDQASSYLVRWAGYPIWESTYEPARNIEQDVPEEVTKYWDKIHKPSSSNTPPPSTSRSSSSPPPAPVPADQPRRSARQRHTRR